MGDSMELARYLLRRLPPYGWDRLKSELRRYVRAEDESRHQAINVIMRGDLEEAEAAAIAYQEKFGELDPEMVLSEIEEEKRERKELGIMTSGFTDDFDAEVDL